jgi:hypothetical protein
MVTFKILDLLVCVDETKESCTTTWKCENWPPAPPPPGPSPSEGLVSLMAQLTQAMQASHPTMKAWLAQKLENAATELRKA